MLELQGHSSSHCTFLGFMGFLMIICSVINTLSTDLVPLPHTRAQESVGIVFCVLCCRSKRSGGQLIAFHTQASEGQMSPKPVSHHPKKVKGTEIVSKRQQLTMSGPRLFSRYLFWKKIYTTVAARE